MSIPEHLKITHQNSLKNISSRRKTKTLFSEPEPLRMAVLQEQKPTPEAPRTIIFSICSSGDTLINKAHKSAYFH